MSHAHSHSAKPYLPQQVLVSRAWQMKTLQTCTKQPGLNGHGFRFRFNANGNGQDGKLKTSAPQNNHAEKHEPELPAQTRSEMENRQRNEFFAGLNAKMAAFVNEGTGKPEEIGQAILSLGKSELETVWNLLRGLELRVYGTWVYEFRSINPEIKFGVKFQEEEKRHFEGIDSLLGYLAVSKEKLSKFAFEDIRSLEVGKEIYIDGRNNSQYAIVRAGESYDCAKNKCVFCCEGTEIAKLTESQESYGSFEKKLQRLDEIFSLVWGKYNEFCSNPGEVLERNRHGIANHVMLEVVRLLNAARKKGRF